LRSEGGHVERLYSNTSREWLVVVSEAVNAFPSIGYARCDALIVEEANQAPRITVRFVVNPRRHLLELLNEANPASLLGAALGAAAKKTEKVEKAVMVEGLLTLEEDAAITSVYRAWRYDCIVVYVLRDVLPMVRNKVSAWGLSGLQSVRLPDGTQLKPVGTLLRSDTFDWVPTAAVDSEGGRIWIDE
jgi:hypothetical protein